MLKDESLRASEAAGSEMTLKVVGVARVKDGVENTSKQPVALVAMI